MDRSGGSSENVLDRAGEEALYVALRRFWHPVMWADELKDGPRAATLLDEPIAVVRLGGEVAAFKDLCVHRGTALSLGWTDGERLVCAYHGWTYDRDGVCIRIPSTHGDSIPRKARLVRYQAVERHGLIWVCLADDEPQMPIPDFPEFADGTYRSIKIPVYDWACSAARRVENFVDFSHFPWVHEGILGDRSRPEIPDHEVVRDATSLRFELGVEEPANPLKADVADGKVQREPSTYTLFMPFSVHLDQPLPDGRHFVAVRHVLPNQREADAELHLERAQLPARSRRGRRLRRLPADDPRAGPRGGRVPAARGAADRPDPGTAHPRR